VYEIKCWI